MTETKNLFSSTREHDEISHLACLCFMIIFTLRSACLLDVSGTATELWLLSVIKKDFLVNLSPFNVSSSYALIWSEQWLSGNSEVCQSFNSKKQKEEKILKASNWLPSRGDYTAWNWKDNTSTFLRGTDKYYKKKLCESQLWFKEATFGNRETT